MEVTPKNRTPLLLRNPNSFVRSHLAPVITFQQVCRPILTAALLGVVKTASGACGAGRAAQRGTRQGRHLTVSAGRLPFVGVHRGVLAAVATAGLGRGCRWAADPGGGDGGMLTYCHGGLYARAGDGANHEAYAWVAVEEGSPLGGRNHGGNWSPLIPGVRVGRDLVPVGGRPHATTPSPPSGLAACHLSVAPLMGFLPSGSMCRQPRPVAAAECITSPTGARLSPKRWQVTFPVTAAAARREPQGPSADAPRCACGAQTSEIEKCKEGTGVSRWPQRQHQRVAQLTTPAVPPTGMPPRTPASWRAWQRRQHSPQWVASSRPPCQCNALRRVSGARLSTSPGDQTWHARRSARPAASGAPAMTPQPTAPPRWLAAAPHRCAECERLPQMRPCRTATAPSNTAAGWQGGTLRRR